MRRIISFLCILIIFSSLTALAHWSPSWRMYNTRDNESMHLEIGWNLLGWCQNYSIPASNLSVTIPGCLSISKWVAENQTYWTYIVGGPPSFDFNLTKGIGFFVDVTEESDYTGCS